MIVHKPRILFVSLDEAVKRNFGSFLQCFSLQFLYSDSVALNLKAHYSNYVSSKRKKQIPVLWRLLGLFRKWRVQKIRIVEYERLHTTKAYYAKESILCAINDFDVYILTSDQLWNDDFIFERERLYFLDFGKPEAKRIAYAASIGKKRWPKKFEQRILPMLRNFNAISVREFSAVEYLAQLGVGNATCVCDPTILHNGDFYRSQFREYTLPELKYVYVYRMREDLPDALLEILPNNTIVSDMCRRQKRESVAQWLGYIDGAEFVVTDSFHGTVFCILLHTQFLVIPNRSSGIGMNERFAALLGKTGLEYRILTCDETREQLQEILETSVDWEHVDAVLEEWRAYSTDWLSKALEL